MNRLIAGGCVLGVALLVLPTAIHRLSVSAAPVVCETSAHAFLGKSALRGMTKFQDATFTSSPFADFMASTAGVPVVQDFRRARLLGYITDEVLQGKHGQKNGGKNYAQGHLSGPWPAVPLTGSIVTRAGKRMLEWYETISAYSTSRAAKMHMRMLRHAHDGSERWDSFPATLGDDTYAYAATPLRLKGHAQGEWGFGINTRLGDDVVQIGISGGRGLSRATAMRLASEAVRKLTVVCGIRG